MKENLIVILLIAFMSSMMVSYCVHEQNHSADCKKKDGWYYRGHCFKDGKDI